MNSNFVYRMLLLALFAFAIAAYRTHAATGQEYIAAQYELCVAAISSLLNGLGLAG